MHGFQICGFTYTQIPLLSLCTVPPNSITWDGILPRHSISQFMIITVQYSNIVIFTACHGKHILYMPLRGLSLA